MIPGFKRFKPRRRSTCALIVGKGGSGKSTFVLDYCPQPIAFFNFDGRADDAVEKALNDGRDISYEYISTDVDMLTLNTRAKKESKQAYDRFFTLFDNSIKYMAKKRRGTVAIDTGTELDRLMNIAIKGTTKPAKDYGASKDVINQSWAKLFDDARKHRVHLVVLARTADEWKANEPTGRVLQRGNDLMYDLADWAGEIRIIGNHKKGKLERFEIEIIKAGTNAQEYGAVYKDKDWKDTKTLISQLEEELDEAEIEGDEMNERRLTKEIKQLQQLPDGLGPFAYSCSRLYPTSHWSDWL
jgi:hypothetical protein